MDIIEAMDGQNRITFIHNCIVDEYIKTAVKPIDIFHSFCRTSKVEV